MYEELTVACERKDKLNMAYIKFVVIVGVAVLLASTGLGQADETAIAGNKIMNSCKDAIVKVEVVVQNKWMMNGKEIQNRESKSEITGTVLDPSGLVLVSFTAIDPSKFMEGLISGMGNEMKMKMDMKLTLKDVKVILPDETELDAKVVLRDKDLDMAFIRPTQKTAKPMASVKMSDQSHPRIMDEIVILSRLDKVASHAPSVMSTRISAVVIKPRTFYVPQLAGGGMEYIGTPAFTLDGKLVGVVLMRVLTNEGGTGFSAMMGGTGAMGITAVIMPVSEILEASKQAVDEPKEETKEPKVKE